MIMLTDLVSNAIKFSGDNGSVAIESRLTTTNPKMLAVTVSNSGYGIHRDNLPKLFDRLYQVDSNRNSLDSHNTSATGLGLGLT